MDDAHKPQASTAPELHGILAEYDTPDQLISAAEQVKQAGFEKWDTYSPFQSMASTRPWASR